MTHSQTPHASDALAVFSRTGNAPERFELHDRGVVHQQGDTRRYAAFADIQDLCLYASEPAQDGADRPVDCLAYRRRADEPWTVASGIAEFDTFMDAFRSHYVAQRLPALQALTDEGASATFRYIVDGNFPDMETREVSLSAQGLHIGNATWAYESLLRIDLNDWRKMVSLQDDSGKTVFSCPVTRIFSSDLFVNLVYDQLGQTAEYA